MPLPITPKAKSIVGLFVVAGLTLTGWAVQNTYWIFDHVMKAEPDHLNAGPNVSGTWTMAELDEDSSVRKGIARLELTDLSHFIGEGVDSHGAFRIEDGLMNGNDMDFFKVYTSCAHKHSREHFKGHIDWEIAGPTDSITNVIKHAAGTYTYSKRTGFGWRGQIVTIEHRWEGEMTFQIPGG